MNGLILPITAAVVCVFAILWVVYGLAQDAKRVGHIIVDFNFVVAILLIMMLLLTIIVSVLDIIH